GEFSRTHLWTLSPVVLVDRLLEADAADQPHGVIRAPILVGPQAVDRHDSGVLQAAGDLGFTDEPGAAVRVVGCSELDLLQGDITAQLFIPGEEDRAEPTAGVRADDAEPLARG